MRYWLMKSEPAEYGIDDLVRDGSVAWFGVRNYQARNFMRDQMQPGDQVLFWHSSCPQPGIAGLAEVASAAVADSSQFDPASPYFDARSRPEAPRWVSVTVRGLRPTRLISPAELRSHAELAEMTVLKRGNRLSITPVTPAEWAFITEQLI